MNGSREITETEIERLEKLNSKDEDELSDSEITSKIKLSVKRRFDFPTWVLVFEFQNRDKRRADCLALNTIESRNYKLVGFEFKASRSDWLEEKRNHEKADFFVQLCDEWYIVAGRRGIINEKELPPGWGLFELKPSGQLWKLVESDLSHINGIEPDRRFFAKFLKKSVGGDSNFTHQDIKEAERRGYQKAKEKQVEKHLDYTTERLKEKAESFDKIRESGLSIYPPIDEEKIEKLKAAERLINGMDDEKHRSLLNEIDSLERFLERRFEGIEDNLAEMRNSINTVGGKIQEEDNQTNK